MQLHMHMFHHHCLGNSSQVDCFYYIPQNIFNHDMFSRVWEVNSWRDRDVDEIMQYHPDGVFTSFNPDERHHIEWDELRDILHSSDLEIPIYCNKGFTIPCHIPCFSRNTCRHGVLMDLHSVKELFQTLWEDDMDLGLDSEDNEDSQDITCYTYP